MRVHMQSGRVLSVRGGWGRHVQADRQRRERPRRRGGRGGDRAGDSAGRLRGRGRLDPRAFGRGRGGRSSPAARDPRAFGRGRGGRSSPAARDPRAFGRVRLLVAARAGARRRRGQVFVVGASAARRVPGGSRPGLGVRLARLGGAQTGGRGEGGPSYFEEGGGERKEVRLVWASTGPRPPAMLRLALGRAGQACSGPPCGVDRANRAVRGGPRDGRWLFMSSSFLPSTHGPRPLWAREPPIARLCLLTLGRPSTATHPHPPGAWRAWRAVRGDTGPAPLPLSKTPLSTPSLLSPFSTHSRPAAPSASASASAAAAAAARRASAAAPAAEIRCTGSSDMVVFDERRREGEKGGGVKGERSVSPHSAHTVSPCLAPRRATRPRSPRSWGHAPTHAPPTHTPTHAHTHTRTPERVRVRPRPQASGRPPPGA